MTKYKNILKIKVDKGEDIIRIEEGILDLINNCNLNCWEVMGVLEDIKRLIYLSISVGGYEDEK